MQASHDFQAQTAAMLDDLVRDSLHILAPVTGVIIWAWASLVALFNQAHTVYAYVALALILATGVASYQFSLSSLHVAVAIYLLGFTALITTVVLAYQTSNVL